MEFKGWEESPGHKLTSGNYLEDLLKAFEKENYLFLQTLLVPPSPESLVIPPSFL